MGKCDHVGKLELFRELRLGNFKVAGEFAGREPDRNYVRHYANDRFPRGAKAENNVLTFLEFLFTQKNVLFVGYGLDELEVLEYVIGKAA